MDGKTAYTHQEYASSNLQLLQKMQELLLQDGNHTLLRYEDAGVYVLEWCRPTFGDRFVCIDEDHYIGSYDEQEGE